MGKMGCRVPMIRLTRAGDETDDMRAQQAGAAYYIDKGDLTGPSLERLLRFCHAAPVGGAAASTNPAPATNRSAVIDEPALLLSGDLLLVEGGSSD
jgi:hypothetical protein